MEAAGQADNLALLRICYLVFLFCSALDVNGMCTSCEMKVQPEERPLCWCSVQLHEHVAQRSGSGRELAGDVLLCSIRGSPGTVLCPNSGLAIILGNQQVGSKACVPGLGVYSGSVML